MKIIAHGWPIGDFEKRFLPTIEEMTRDRGWIINSYSQIEFLAADLIVKCRKFGQYKKFNEEQLPFGIEKRVERVIQLCSLGPLGQYADELVPLMGHVLELEETRHFFTHGFLSVHLSKDGDEMAMHLRRYVPPRKGERETRAELLVLPHEMAAARVKWVIFAQTTVETIRRVYSELELESHDVTSGDPLRM